MNIYIEKKIFSENEIKNMLPNVGEDVRLGNINIDIAKREWKKLSPLFVPYPLIVVIYGSVASGNVRPYSDIDILLVSEKGDRVVRRQATSNGFLFDITIFPQGLVEQIAIEASKALSPGRITPFLQGIPIDGNLEMFLEMKAKVLRIYSKREKNIHHLLASMENKLIGMLIDSTFCGDETLRHCFLQEARFVALNILSLRMFRELLPPSMMLQQINAEQKNLVAQLIELPAEDTDRFVRYIVEKIGFKIVPDGFD